MPYSTSDQCTGFKTFYLPQSQQQQWTGFPEPPLTCVNDMGSTILILPKLFVSILLMVVLEKL